MSSPAPRSRPRPNSKSPTRGTTPARRTGSQSGSAPRRGDDRPVRRPKTEAERRSQEVKARREPRATPTEPPSEATRDRWVPERWQDEGPLREIAEQAAARGRTTGDTDAAAHPRPAKRVADPSRLDPQWVEDVKRHADARTSARYMERLAAATEALERDRYRDSLRMVSSVLKNLPEVGAAHEVAGLAYYRLGEWRKAVAALEEAQRLHPTPEQLPIIADCYRALRRYAKVDEVWAEIKAMSPAPAVMAEGRIVAAGALADRGDLQGALKLLLRNADAPKKVRDYHLKQWYVIADLYDRSGDVVRARHFFKRIVNVDPRYADVGDRLATLGRR